MDDSGDHIAYTFTAMRGDKAPLLVGPQAESAASFDLGLGAWTVSVSVDDGWSCAAPSAYAMCSTEEGLRQAILKLPAKDPAVMDRAAREIVKFGPAASTPLVEALGGEDEVADLGRGVALDVEVEYQPSRAGFVPGREGLASDGTLSAIAVAGVERAPRPASLRLAHLSPDAPAVDVLVDGSIAAAGAPFGAVSGYLDVAPGD